MALAVLRSSSRTLPGLLAALTRRSVTIVDSSACRSLNTLTSFSGCRSLDRLRQTNVRLFGAFGPDRTPLDMADVERRVLKICSSYDKIDPSSVFSIQKRSYGHKSPLTYDFIVERVMLVFELYDKVDNSKLKMDAHFANDLGLDSLDHVEVIMAIEDEFSFEIPDRDAEKLWTPADIIKYVADKEESWRELQ